MLRPGDGVAERRRSVGSGVVSYGLGDFEERVSRCPGYPFHHLWCVARVVASDDLEDATRVLERHVALGRVLHQRADERIEWRAFWDLSLLGTRLLGLPGWDRLLARLGSRGGATLIADRAAVVLPAAWIVLADEAIDGVPGVGTQAREDAAQILGVLEVLVDDRRGVGVVHDVITEVTIVLDHVADKAAEEGDVCPGPNRHVLIGYCRGSGEAGIDVDDLRALQLRLHHPSKRDRMVLGHVGALNDDAVRVGEASRVHGRGTPPHPRPQTGDAGAVSDAGLVFDGDDPQSPQELLV